MSVTLKQQFFLCNRYFSTSICCCGKKKSLQFTKYRTRFEEPYSERSDVQRLLNAGKKLIPFDKNLEITGKNTGPSVEGGSEHAAKLAAKHVVPFYGYYNKYGRFITVRNMKPNFVVPDLNGFELKPYVPYKTVAVNQSKFTAEDLYRERYRQDLEEDIKKIELGTPLEEVISARMKMIDESEAKQNTKQSQEILSNS